MPAIEIEVQPDRHRRTRIALPVLLRRESCMAKRAMLAALREADLAAWQANGGDSLRSK